MKRVLLLAYHFPPDGLVGAARSFKFARYLPEHDWEPIVLTVPEAYAELYDATHQEEVARQMRVTRVRPWPGPRQLYAALRERKAQSTEHKALDDAGQPAAFPALRFVPGALRLRSTATTFRRALLAAMWLPDDKQGWFWPGVVAGLRLIRQNGVDLLVSTGPPWTAHLMGLTLSRLSGKPWVADFRDPWACCSLKPPQMRTRATDAIECWMERRVARHADRIVVTIPTLAERLREQYPWLRQRAKGEADRVVVIPNGFDPAEKTALGSRLSALGSTKAMASCLAERHAPALAERRAPSAERRLTFVYGGNLYGARDPVPFLAALRELIARRPEAAPAVRAIFVGGEQEVGGRPLAEVASRMGLEEQVEAGGPLPYREYLALLAHADVPLLFIDQETQIPAKLFDLLLLEKPVLAFGRTDSPAAQILTETGAGVTLRPDDSDGIRRQLERFWEAHRGDRLSVSLDPTALRRYDVRALTATLAETLDQVIGALSCGGGNEPPDETTGARCAVRGARSDKGTG
jgi:glycosyltransferase involved in cell wall biosynthesis